MSKSKPASKAKKAAKPPKPERRIGRIPNAFSEEDIVNLENLIGSGNSTIASCEALGISERDFYNWIERSQEHNPNPVYVDFALRMKKARGRNKVAGIAEITKHAANDWRARAWLLERQFPDEFGQHDKVDVNHKGAVQHDHTQKVIHFHVPAAIAQPRVPRRISPTDT